MNVSCVNDGGTVILGESSLLFPRGGGGATSDKNRVRDIHL